MVDMNVVYKIAYPNGSYPPPPPHHGGPSFGGGVSIGIGATAGAVAIQVDCSGYYRKWQSTGDKFWKLTYYECTGQL